MARLLSLSNGHRRRAAVTVALGLSSGAVGWSGLGNAAGEETASQVLLLPEHYELLDNGVVVFKLETGETLSLTSDQYLILEDGLLMITDELAQASVYSLPVMGSVRAQLMTDVQPVRSPDGFVVLASDDSPLWSGDGPAPRLSDQVELQRYEIAQTSDGSSNNVEEAVAVGLLSPGAIALLGVLMTSDQPEQAPSGPQLHPYAGQTWKVDDLHPGADLNSSGSTEPYDMHALDGKLYFRGYDGSEYELYVYDPDTGATTAVASADKNSSGSTAPRYMQALKGKLYFRGTADSAEYELYVYDPVANTTIAVTSADKYNGVGGTEPYYMRALDGKLYFRGTADGSERELYVYDPVAGTTEAVAGADLWNSGSGT